VSQASIGSVGVAPDNELMESAIGLLPCQVFNKAWQHGSCGGDHADPYVRILL
jgi:hypothetical protein